MTGSGKTNPTFDVSLPHGIFHSAEQLSEAAMKEFAMLSKREFLATASGAAIGAFIQPAMALENSPAKPVVTTRAPLASPQFHQFPSGAITPKGWLKSQLQIQAAGLGGKLDEIWPDVGPNSGWLGGAGESWERGPYFLDGLLSLAWQLDDAVLKAKAQRFIDWTLSSQQPNGMFGPKSNDDWWPRIVMLKVLTQYCELTDDPRVVPLMTAYFKYQLEELPKRPLRDWGKFRWQDQLLTVIWLYNRTGDGALLDLMKLLKAQGFDWQRHFAAFPFKDKTSKAALDIDHAPIGDLALSAHGVNIAQSLKQPALWYLVSGDQADRDAVGSHLRTLDQYHGMPTGLFSADEHLGGRDPSAGTELCTVVEEMFSLEVTLAVTGDVKFADRLEKIAFNALPATLSEDMWSHQYDQQPNQIECSLHQRRWTSNGPESNLFGLDPNFGCCTANFHQGWPKLTSSLWLASADGGVAAAIYAPSTLVAELGGAQATIHQTTDYPFRNSTKLTVKLAAPAQFPLHLRIPQWSEGVAIRVNGSDIEASPPGTFTRVEREWKNGDQIELTFKNPLTAMDGAYGSVTVQQGPLLFALPIKERWEKLLDRGQGAADWAVHPESGWNFALKRDAAFERIEGPITMPPFSHANRGLAVKAPGIQIADWKIAEQSAGPIPQHPVASGGATSLQLVPYASAKLRITAFPTIA